MIALKEQFVLIKICSSVGKLHASHNTYSSGHYTRGYRFFYEGMNFFVKSLEYINILNY